MSEAASSLRLWGKGDYPQDERRGAARYRCIWDASCATLSTCERIPAALRDLSQTGIGLSLPGLIDPGAYLIVDVKRGAWTLVSLVARAVRSARLADGESVVGCRLTTPLSLERVQLVLGGLPETGRQSFSLDQLANTFTPDGVTMPY
jgi:hypothetical protein